ncbi:biotin-dependent carboxyltransferase family protein [Flavihumibacter sp. CACIAM 22H1]|uniref:5-oxoprolinase subunit C family protein n=1 Tax=Flavihumibacter sp. CACIAM 22H1 TaxID=1812911 RepID=UPI0007A834EA|nr:biotin-dependent carboxyltransferase family protein [Flavihumibacter sp. CACIAM 22H1]KYP15774.1 MAG: hypothetical protein A1D16_05405 [Flavihumibacter sp. CACIAM 22H1]
MRVLKSGICTIQDLGRFGNRNRGLPVSGFMDPLAAKLGNLLTGNDSNAASLEISRGAFSASFETTCLLALTGKGYTAYISGRPIPFYHPFLIKAGEFLQLFPKETGFTYLSVHGGIRSNPVFGSRSTHLASKLGGQEGRPLRAGDQLPVTVLPDENGQRIIDYLLKASNHHQVGLSHSVLPDYTCQEIRFIAGAEYSWFSGEALNLLQSSGFRPSALSNRMGSRFTGPELKRIHTAELLSQAVLPGTIQVSPDGQLLVLFADAQTTGGYPRIGQIIQADLHLAAQCSVDNVLHFKQVSIENAENLLLQQEKQLLQLKRDYYLYFS